MNRKLWALTVIIEVIGIAVASAGIGLELALKAHWCFGLITGGSVLVATGATIYAKFSRRA